MGSKFSKGEQSQQSDLTKNEKWVKQIEEYFDSVDLNKNGYVTIEEILKWSDNIREQFKVTPDEEKNLRESLEEFYGATGLVSGKQVTKAEFVQGANRLAQAELKRKTNGEVTLHEKMCNALYDVMDDNEDGTVSLEELTRMMKACNMDEAKAQQLFDKADKNENGKVERKELTQIEFDMWFKPEDDNSGTEEAN